MLSELKFVQRAVSKKDFVPAMTHFSIQDGLIRSYNGVIALCCRIPIDINCNPKAEPLIKAISNCSETVVLNLTDSNRLKIQSGNFKAFIDCIDGDTPHVMPEGEIIEIDGNVILEAFRKIITFVGEDASRPWANGILLKGSSAFATNNVCLIEYWLSANIPIEVNIPKVAIKELLRINEAPISIQLTDKSITFHFPENRWLRSQLLTTEWPDLEKILNRDSNPVPINHELFTGLDVIKPFVGKLGHVFFKGSKLMTSLVENEGASYELDNFEYKGTYHIEILPLLKGVAEQIDLSSYPNPCIFYGERLRGAIIGIKLQ